MKICNVCGVAKPPEEYHRKKSSKDGRRGICKKCRAEKEGFNYRKEAKPGYRYCRMCEKELPANGEYFYKDPSQKCGYGSYCIPCTAKHVHNWQINNTEKVRGYKDKYAKDNVEKTREAGRKHYHSNKDKYRQYYLDNYGRHLERGRAWYRNNIERARKLARLRSKKWVRSNPARARAVTQRRAARKNNLPDTFTAADWQAALNYFDGCCAVCDRPPGFWHTLAVDHWIPLSSSSCPGTIPENIVPLCHGRDGCNNSKGGKDPGEWLELKFSKNKANQINRKIEEFFQWITKP